MKITAIIPIKHLSTRVPGKNYRLMNGYPLFFYIINSLLQVPEINNIIIDTDSATIKQQVPTFFPQEVVGNKITIYDRPEHLKDGSTATNDLLLNVIQDLNLDADYFIQTHTTNPMLKSITIQQALKQFLNQSSDYESLFSVKTHYTRFYNKDGEDLNHNRFKLIPTQDLDPIYEENSCLYIFSKEILEKYQARIAPKALLFPMNDIESSDIDWEEDFKLVEQLKKIGL